MLSILLRDVSAAEDRQKDGRRIPYFQSKIAAALLIGWLKNQIAKAEGCIPRAPPIKGGWIINYPAHALPMP